MPSHFIHALQWLRTTPRHEADYTLAAASSSSSPPFPERLRLLPSTSSVIGTARTGTLASSVLILISSVFGSSILAVPYAFSKCGWALGTLCLLACGGLTQIGACLLLECTALVQTKSKPSSSSRHHNEDITLSQIASLATPRLAFLPDLLVVFNCMGSAVAALVVAGT